MKRKGFRALLLGLAFCLIPSIIWGAKEETRGKYASIEGTIRELRKKGDQVSILLEGDLGPDDLILFHIDYDVLVCDMVSVGEDRRQDLKAGMKIEVFASGKNPVTMTKVPQMKSDLVLIKNGDLNVKLDYFNEDMVSSDGKVKLDLGGKLEVSKSNLFVLYEKGTKSLPSQVKPKLLVRLNKEGQSGDFAYLEKSARLKSISTKGEDISLLVEGTDGDFSFIVDEKTSLDDMTLTEENKWIHLKEGAKLTGIYPNDRAFEIIYPMEIKPELLLIENGDLSFKVDFFDQELLSPNRDLQLILKDPYKDIYKDQYLGVLYGDLVLSLPNKAKAFKVFLLNGPKNHQSNLLKLNLIQEDGISLVGLREAGEGLGYQVIWSGEGQPIDLRKQDKFISLRLNESSYTYNGIEKGQLEGQTQMKGSKIFVPISLFTDQLGEENIFIIGNQLIIK